MTATPDSLASEPLLKACRASLNRLVELSDDQAAVPEDPELVAALEPLTLLPPSHVRCRHAGRGRTLSWWAIVPGAALVAFADQRRQAKDSSNLGGYYELSFDEQHPLQPFAGWISEARSEQTRGELAANPDLASRWPLRFTFTCRRCGSSHPLTNSTMLRKYVEAAFAHAASQDGGGAAEPLEITL